MKSEVKQAAIERLFPKLMISTANGTIVLFSKHGTGTCVNAGESINRIGESSTEWHMPHFTDFTGTVTLSND